MVWVRVRSIVYKGGDVERRASPERLVDEILDLADVLLAGDRVEVALAKPDRAGRNLNQLVVVTVRDGLLERLRIVTERVSGRQPSTAGAAGKCAMGVRKMGGRTIVLGGASTIPSSLPAARMLVSCFVLQTLISSVSVLVDSPMTMPT